MKCLTLALLVMLAAVMPVHAQDDDAVAIDDTPHITIVGSAKTEVASDLAVISLGVTSHKPTAVAAADAVAVNAKAVLDAAKAQGIPGSDIATQSITLAQSFENVFDPKGRYIGRKPTGFDALNKIAIRIRNLAKAGEVAQSLIDKGANAFDGIDFTVSDARPILDKLAAEAVTNARRQADIVARAAGVKLGRVLLIQRSSDGQRAAPPVYVPPPLDRAAEPKVMPIQAGTESFEVAMKVTWSIAE